MKKRSEKQQDLDKLKLELAKVSTVILTTFQGITVEADTKLRRAVQAAGGKYQVVKNSLAERAGAGTPAENLLKNLSGTNSIAFTQTDAVALAKALTKVAKEVPAFQYKSGVVEGRAAQQDHVPAERSGAAHRHGFERPAAQPRGHRQRGDQGQQVWVRRG
jgi:large subunit ribosomal protein L10